MKLNLPGTHHAYDMYESLKEMGHKDLGTQSIVYAVARYNDLKWDELMNPKKEES
jgi:hypothetical protein